MPTRVPTDAAAADGGTSRKVGHKYLFGNTEDQCRIDNLGCAPRGRPTDGNIVRATAWTLHDAAQKAKGRLCGKRAGSPAALG